MASDDSVDEGKRRFLVGASSVVGGIGVAGAATPFVMSFWPSERAKAAGAPIEVDIAKVEPGQKIDVEWRGKVVWIINRTKPMLDSLPKLNPVLADPDSKVPQQPPNCKNIHRSIKDAMFVAVGICTHPRLLADVPSGDRRRPTSVPIGSAASSARAINRSSTSPARLQGRAGAAQPGDSARTST
jgi:ubiquinol-cytochrome c reductase iron-sulfur subunit